jgi:CelD/BcsL family acetyltransferase involved in cellulose biosynthesis
MSGITVAQLDDSAAGEAAWDKYVESHPASTIYHLHAWRRIFERSFGYHSWLLLARNDADNAICGVLPLYQVQGLSGRRLVSVPFRDRGGPLWHSAEAFNALIGEARKIAAGTGISTVTLKTTTAYPRELVETAALRQVDHWIHSAVDLCGVTAELLWQRIGDKNRNMVRHAQRSGLQCMALPHAESSVRAWYELHVATQKRLGVPPFPLAYFRHLCAELGSNRLMIFGVSAGGSLVAATIVFLHGKTGIYAYSASLSGSQKQGANDLMLHAVMLWLVERGHHCFDMGSDSPVQDNLLFFKRKWLAEQHPIPFYYWGADTPPVVDSSSAVYRLARAVFSRLPAPVLTTFGSRITRFFG